MNAVAGNSGVLLAFLAATAGAITTGLGLRRSAGPGLRHGQVYAALVLTGALAATGAMESALIGHDFSLIYVAQNGNLYTPLLYTITGMWSALAGSILLWGLILAGYLALMVWRFRHRVADPLIGWATLVVYVTAAFFFGLMLGPANPFKTLPPSLVPHNGAGPNVLLQDNPLVALHPPMLYLGFVGFVIPFAFALASLITGRLDEPWMQETRRWVLFAWGFLTAGILLGAWWYQVLGWGGFWAWDPVENAALLPWLCATAYLHSSVVQQRRGMFRVWNISLVVATFSLTIFGTFLTRSGVIQSVHAFSESTLGPYLIAFLGVVVVAGVGLIWWRGDQLRSPPGVKSVLTREGAFLVNNLTFAALAFVVLLGTVFPLLMQLVTNQQVTVGRPYFDTMTLPLGLTLLFFMAIGPLLPWRQSTGGLLRKRLKIPAWAAGATVAVCVAAGVRGLIPLVAFGLGAFAATSALRQIVLAVRAAHRQKRPPYHGLVGPSRGGMVVHLGIVVIAVAFTAASSFAYRSEVTLATGQSVHVDGHTLRYIGLASVRTPVRNAIKELVRVDGAGPFAPAVTTFAGATEAVGTPAIDSTPLADVYLTVVRLPSSRHGKAIIGVVIQPLVLWLWVGGALVILGTALAAIPVRTRSEETSDSGGDSDESESESEMDDAIAVSGVEAGNGGGAEAGIPATVSGARTV